MFAVIGSIQTQETVLDFFPVRQVAEKVAIRLRDAKPGSWRQIFADGTVTVNVPDRAALAAAEEA